jgi:hypothetical protein
MLLLALVLRWIAMAVHSLQLLSYDTVAHAKVCYANIKNDVLLIEISIPCTRLIESNVLHFVPFLNSLSLRLAKSAQNGTFVRKSLVPSFPCMHACMPMRIGSYEYKGVRLVLATWAVARLCSTSHLNYRINRHRSQPYSRIRLERAPWKGECINC